MTPLKQEGRRTCGQVCVAMAVGATEMGVCDVIDKITGASTKDLQKALRYYGVTFGRKLCRATKKDPLFERFPRAILSAWIKDPENNYIHGHYMLRWDGRIYDPGEWWPACAGGTKITSALVLTGRPGLPW